MYGFDQTFISGMGFGSIGDDVGVVIQFPGSTPKTVKDVYDAMTKEKQTELHYILGLSLEFLDTLKSDEKEVVKFLITNAVQATKEQA